VAIRGAYSEGDSALARVQPVCASGEAGGAESADAPEIVGPSFGAKASDEKPTPFEIACPHGTSVEGIFGTKDDWVHGAGLVCSGMREAGEAGPGPSTRSASAGASDARKGTKFDLGCPAGTRVAGIAGRSGSLIDRLGVLCAPRSP